MKGRGLSAPQLADLMGRPAVTIGRWARGDTVPSALDLSPLAEALGVDPRLFIDPPPIPEYPLESYYLPDPRPAEAPGAATAEFLRATGQDQETGELPDGPPPQPRSRARNGPAERRTR
jgi:transcriptional regulator with XRE-family HTH domain